MSDITALAAGVQLAVFDVDGVFTDGRLHFSDNGELFKTFHVRDGYGIKRLLQNHVEVAVISGRESAAVIRRMQDLHVRHVFQGIDDKRAVLDRLLAELHLNPQQTACVGDDLPDLPLMQAAGLAIAVADARPEVRAEAHYVTTARGGQGAVREVCDLLLTARNARA